MFDDNRELLTKIQLGADSILELKEVRTAGQRVLSPSRDSLADELAAFANSRGGVCVLGIEDRTRQVLGIPLEALDAVEAFVCQICNDSIEPPLVARIEKLSLPSPRGVSSGQPGEDNYAPVLRIDVPSGLFVHQSPGGYYHRVGSSKRRMPPDYLARLFQQRSQSRIIRFDESIIPRASLEDLSEPLWKRFETLESAADSREVFLHKLGFARQTPDDSTWRPTVAGVLLASADPRRFLPNAFIQAVAYRGEDSSSESSDSPYQLDAADITGPLDQQVDQALRFVARNMRTAAVKSIGRHDIPQYDLTAIFEALVNAVAHRDYAIHGSKIRLRLYANRLELFSPGALANTMTVESLPLRQSARNEVLTSLLARCPVPRNLAGWTTGRTAMMDPRGEGVHIILARTAALAGKRTEYSMIDQEELRLVAPAATGELPIRH
jgi:predicted HTH transcriptional regulator